MITKAAKEIAQKELKENIIKLKHEKKDIGNGKYATWLNRAAFVVKEKHGKLYKRDYRERQKRSFTPIAVHYEKMSNYLRETATNSAKIHSLARKYEHLRINEIQLRFLHFNQHSITLLGIHMRHWAYKREKYTFINANIKVINTILKVNRDNRQTLKCKRYSLTFL